MATLQYAIRDRLKDSATLVAQGITPLVVPENAGGLGFGDVWARWLTPERTPAAFHTDTGQILPTIVVQMRDENPHTSPHIPGWDKWDTFPHIYCFHYPGEHGKEILDRAKLSISAALQHPSWQPVITGGQLPTAVFDNETHIDDDEQFPGNYVTVLRFRMTGVRSVPGY